MVNFIYNENISCAIYVHLCSSTAIELVFLVELRSDDHLIVVKSCVFDRLVLVRITFQQQIEKTRESNLIKL